MITDVFTIPFPWVENDISSLNNSNLSEPLAVRQFIGGPENKLVQVAYEAIATQKTELNPLVIYGASGVGKSHIAYGLLSLLKQNNTKAKLLQLTGADYVRRCSLTSELDSNQTRKSPTASENALRKQLLNVDCLLLENLHELANFPNAQESLVLLLDQLQDQGVSILMTCLDHPTQTDRFSARLASRISQGFLVPVELPGTRTKEVILKQMAHSLGLQLTDVAARKIAEAFPYTLPRLNSLLLEISLQIPDQRIDSETVRRFTEQKQQQDCPTLPTITNLTARYYRVKTSDIKSPTRKQAIVQARNCAMYLARKLTGQSFQAIGKYFGGRDHTTVMHAINRVEESLCSDYALKDALAELETLITHQSKRSP